MHVASVSYVCCKNRSECYICCNGYTCMLQASVPNVLFIFLDVYCICFTLMLRVFYLDVEHAFAMTFQVFSMCFCKCFRRMFQVFHLSMLQMFHLVILKVDRVLLLETHLPQQASGRGK
jgi:hypothetical protein